MRHITFQLYANARCRFSGGVRHFELDCRQTDARRVGSNLMRHGEVRHQSVLVPASLRDREADTKSNYGFRFKNTDQAAIACIGSRRSEQLHVAISSPFGGNM